MNVFKNVFIKEIKSIIRDPRILIAMIIVPVVFMGIMYGMIGEMSKQAVKEAMTPGGNVIVVDMDHGKWANDFIEFLKKEKYDITMYQSLDEALENYDNVLGVILIPKGFSDNLTNNKPGILQLYFKIKTISFVGMVGGSKLFGVIGDYSEEISKTILTNNNLNPDYVMSPVNATSNVVIGKTVLKGYTVGEIMGSLFMVGLFIPLMIAMLAGFIAQLSATSIAVEKEEKMLETLLSLPMNRMSLMAAKVAAAAVVSMIGGGLYIFIIAWYFTQMTSLGEPSGGQAFAAITAISQVFSGTTQALFAITAFGVLFLVLGITIVLALFVEDVRSAQIISSYIMFPLMISIFIVMFMDASKLSETTRLILSIVPFVNMPMMINYSLLGENLPLILATVSTWIYALIAIYIASRIIGTEKIFTVRLFKRRGRRAKLPRWRDQKRL